MVDIFQVFFVADIDIMDFMNKMATYEKEARQGQFVEEQAVEEFEPLVRVIRSVTGDDRKAYDILKNLYMQMEEVIQ